jgi:hypothetical protein
MKVRIANNKMRFRLKEPEVNSFRADGTISEVLELGTGLNDHLKFTLVATETAEIKIHNSSNEISILVPQAQANKWTSTDLVGFDAEVDTGKGKMVSVLIEKDFMCMDGREEDNLGSYPNPLASEQH